VRDVAKYYFTYGMDERYPFVGGWTEIEAPDSGTACRIFRAVHPDRISGCMNCASVYGENDFSRSRMRIDGNFGKRCVERITIERLESEESV
jgi:hypothetical protein